MQPLEDKDDMYANLPPILAMVIPILAIVMGIGYAMLATWLRYQRRKEVYEMHHRERMLAIERGMEVPPLPPHVFSDFDHKAAVEFEEVASRAGYLMRSPLRRALVWILGGIALLVALYVNYGPTTAAWALIPIAMGLANLGFYLAEARSRPSGPGNPEPDGKPKSPGATPF